jgi:hypothetical protein
MLRAFGPSKRAGCSCALAATEQAGHVVNHGMNSKILRHRVTQSAKIGSTNEQLHLMPPTQVVHLSERRRESPPSIARASVYLNMNPSRLTGPATPFPKML